MPAKKITVPVTPEMERALDELCELHALQLPSLASMLLRDALAGRRSALLPKKRVGGSQSAAEAGDGSEALPETALQGKETASGDSWGLLKEHPAARQG